MTLAEATTHRFACEVYLTRWDRGVPLLSTPGIRTPFDRMVAAHRWPEPFEVEAPDVPACAEAVWMEANVDEPATDWGAGYRAGRQRSLSIGDVIAIDTPDGRAYLQVLGSGFGLLAHSDIEPLIVDEPWSNRS